MTRNSFKYTLAFPSRIISSFSLKNGIDCKWYPIFIIIPPQNPDFWTHFCVRILSENSLLNSIRSIVKDKGNHFQRVVACGDGMFIVQTSFRPTYRGWASDGRAWFDGCGEQSDLRGNQGLCVGAYGIESQQFIYSTGKREMWDYRESEL